MLNTIKEFMYPFGVSGKENEIREKIISKIKPFVDEIKVDNLGNLIALKKGSEKNNKKIMLCSHMDETGFIVDYIDENGYIRVQNVGRFTHKLYENNLLISERGVSGIFAYNDKEETYAVTCYYIDIGVKTKKEAEKKVKIGDMFKYVPYIQKLQGTTYVGKPFSDRIGCAILAELIENTVNPKNDIYFVFTVQNELNGRGALTASYGIAPNEAIIIDTSSADDISKNEQKKIEVSKGTAIKVMDDSFIASSDIVDRLIILANENQINYQLEISKSNTDGGSIQTSANGVLVGGLSIPTRYKNSKSELLDIKDAEATYKLLAKYIVE